MQGAFGPLFYKFPHLQYPRRDGFSRVWLAAVFKVKTRSRHRSMIDTLNPDSLTGVIYAKDRLSIMFTSPFWTGSDQRTTVGSSR